MSRELISPALASASPAVTGTDALLCKVAASLTAIAKSAEFGAIYDPAMTALEFADVVESVANLNAETVKLKAKLAALYALIEARNAAQAA